MAQSKIRTSQVYTVNDPIVGSDPRIAVDEFKIFTPGEVSPGPNAFRSNSLSGFDAYSSTDFPGPCWTGFSVVGPGTVRSAQLAINWDTEEAAPTQMIFRVNDDTTDPTAWSAWANVQVGSTTFTTSTATPTGGRPGDTVYVY